MYQMILFDVDGVLLSEERCFDASALAVWELLYGSHFLELKEGKFTTAPAEEQIRYIRKEVFQEDKILDWMKDRGINANWDMVYLVFSTQLMLLLEKIDPTFVRDWIAKPITEESLLALKKHTHGISPDFTFFSTLFDESKGKLNRDELLVYFNQYVQKQFGVDVDYFSRMSTLWELGRSVYQEWYFGEALFQKEEGYARTKGKQGFLYQESPLAPIEELQQLFADLSRQGITLGIGTGRPYLEMEVPLREMGLLTNFDSNRIVTASDVVSAEGKYPDEAPLGKPHPFTYLLGYLGEEATDQKALELSLPIKDGEKLLVVGDSVADFLAAQSIGCHFAATLTGLTGQAAREKFEELGADYILDDVRQLRTIITA
ncbi:HAD hydrolase-like protein [Shimazuella sp. AN120528]|uniref:HAD family hydrolase n=1 Tax=Shimazuella soli TaxID=1892854 RepID=UPI001F0FA6F0|nr:HAD family hydrolase [Shimazuella soli]MCH5583469.1 HAD hydrolase-like protein [Shimazuella soli]